jgi:ABC-type bacteriocin/lantibiotic exporter with double-glycine peptidase domain
LIELREVSFSYKNNDHKILNNLSLKIESSDFLAITGPTGVGKSTLLDIMIGASQPNSGEVSISGLPPREAFEIYPGKVAIVTQNPYFIDGTIEENLIAWNLGRKFRTQRIIESLSYFKLAETLGKDPLKYRVGENAQNLSGGQRQILALIRALSSNPAILLLDEFTSALDARVQRKMFSHLKTQSSLRIVVMISHRSETMSFANRRLEISKKGAVKLSR